MQSLSSRKLVGSIIAVIGVVVLVLGLAVIHPAALTEGKDVVLAAILGIVGLGGFHVLRQSMNDELIDVESVRYKVVD